MSDIIDVSADQVKQLRSTTGAGIMDCKKALKESAGDIEKAIEYLRIKGISKAESKASRAVAEGIIGSYLHSTGKLGVLIEVNCETDFVARTDEFKQLVADIAMHIAGSDPYPLCVSKDEIDPEIVERERRIYTAQAMESGKPANLVEKIVQGKVDKYIKDICLVDQKFIKNTEITITELIKQKIAKLGENIAVKRFVRFQISK